MSDTILRILELTKVFRSDWLLRPMLAVSDLSLEVRRGEAFGFLGANGAGKTTTLKCILGLVRKTSGLIEFEGMPLVQPRDRAGIGYLPELPYFYEHLTAVETLDYFARLYGIGRERGRRVNEALERVGLADRRRQLVSSLSKGLQQRLGFAQAILHQPRLLLLDEPFSGLDPIGRRDLRKLILELRAGGTTIVMSSHILSDVENICDRVSIMTHGTVRHVFALKDIATMFGESFDITIGRIPETSLLYRKLSQSAVGRADHGTLDRDLMTFSFSSYQAARIALQDVLLGEGRVHRFIASPRSLEDVFLTVTAAPGAESNVSPPESHPT